MPIASSDIEIFLSGGAANAVPSASLGGAKSSVVAGATILDAVDNTESTNGVTDYIFLYVHNKHQTLTLEAAKAWLSANTPSPSTIVAIGLGTSAANGTEQSVVSQSTAPVGVTFVPAATLGAAISLGDILAGQHRGVWLRRIVSPGATALASDTGELRVDGGYTE